MGQTRSDQGGFCDVESCNLVRTLSKQIVFSFGLSSAFVNDQREYSSVLARLVLATAELFGALFCQEYFCQEYVCQEYVCQDRVCQA
jgi:hypothetical protein